MGGKAGDGGRRVACQSVSVRIVVRQFLDNAALAGQRKTGASWWGVAGGGRQVAAERHPLPSATVGLGRRHAVALDVRPALAAPAVRGS